MKTQNQENEIIDICAKILKQDNIIVYPSGGHSVTTCYFVSHKDNKETIFIALSPSNGYGIKIPETNILISGYNSTPDMHEKIRTLYFDCEKKSDQQIKLRAKIAEQEHFTKLKATKCALLKFASKSK